MENKLKTLTETLFNEGVQKGEKEAAEIISRAQNEAKKIIDEANNEAKALREKTGKEIDENKRKAEAEMRLAASQSMNLLKNKISSMLSDELASHIQNNFKEQEFVQEMILTLMKTWVESDCGPFDLKLILPKVNEKNLKNYVAKHAKDILKKNPEIEVSDEFKNGFRIAAQDSSYLVEFSDESFNSFFKTFLKPLTGDLLFKNH